MQSWSGYGRIHGFNVQNALRNDDPSKRRCDALRNAGTCLRCHGRWCQHIFKVVLRGGGHPEIFLGPIFAFFGISKNCMKKEKFWCRLEQNRVTGGPAARVFAKTPKMDPKLKNGHFWRFFENSKNMRFLP